LFFLGVLGLIAGFKDLAVGPGGPSEWSVVAYTFAFGVVFLVGSCRALFSPATARLADLVDGVCVVVASVSMCVDVSVRAGDLGRWVWITVMGGVAVFLLAWWLRRRTKDGTAV
jgi:hypothetical protein